MSLEHGGRSWAQSSPEWTSRIPSMLISFMVRAPPGRRARP